MDGAALGLVRETLVQRPLALGAAMAVGQQLAGHAEQPGPWLGGQVSAPAPRHDEHVGDDLVGRFVTDPPPDERPDRPGVLAMQPLELRFIVHAG